MSFRDLRSFISALRLRGELVEIHAPVDPVLEIAEIHRRVIQEQGPALLFRNVRGSKFPVVTNLFGTMKRVDLAFGGEPKQVIAEVAKLPHEMLPPTIGKLWSKRSLFQKLLKVGLRQNSSTELRPQVTADQVVDLNAVPMLTTWPLDGGPFVTLPLVYTQHPETKIPNLGMYRIQRFDRQTTGLHMQIGKGGGFHLSAAKERGTALPVNIFIGGPPAAILSAIAPLPEDVPELLLASLLIGERLRLSKNAHSPNLPFLADAEFVMVGECDPQETRLEGPFGDHYGYYSLEHQFPVFRCKQLLHRPDAIYPATVVGKPRQEDFYIGNYLQDLLSPLFPVVMPGVRDLWSYGETGFHALSAAVVRERYKREALAHGFRVLGEGQLSLTKFLLLVDKPQDLKDFRSVLRYILERADFRTDLFVFSNVSMDTLDYAGPKLNEGSKGILLGMGPAVRDLPGEFQGELPSGFREPKVFVPGCLVVAGPDYNAEPDAAKRLAENMRGSAAGSWPLVVLTDDSAAATASEEAFLWRTFTRFNPASDIVSADQRVERFHVVLEPPIVIDARMKPWYPGEVETAPETVALVDRRWREYFPSKA